MVEVDGAWRRQSDPKNAEDAPGLSEDHQHDVAQWVHGVRHVWPCHSWADDSDVGACSEEGGEEDQGQDQQRGLCQERGDKESRSEGCEEAGCQARAVTSAEGQGQETNW